MKQITVSAPGKLMLFGEHAVVYDRPCIVTAVSSRIKVTITRTGGRFAIDAPQVKDVRFVNDAIHLFQKKYRVGNGLQIKTESEFSCQYGFGSSSAVTVATLFALSKLFNISLSEKEIFDLGYKVALDVQGVGSGFDIAAATYGGTLYFWTGGKTIKPLCYPEHFDCHSERSEESQCKLREGSLPLVIGYSGIKADTPTIVKKLKFQAPNSKLQINFDKIQQIVEEAKDELVKQHWPKIGELMNKNHKLLQELGVSTDKLDKMCQAAISAGAFGAKLSGAGGGDCMIAIIPEEKRENIEKEIEKAGGQVIRVQPNAEGVRIE